MSEHLFCSAVSMQVITGCRGNRQTNNNNSHFHILLYIFVHLRLCYKKNIDFFLKPNLHFIKYFFLLLQLHQ